MLANERIGRTNYRASVAADVTRTCDRNPDNFGVKANAAGAGMVRRADEAVCVVGCVDYIKVIALRRIRTRVRRYG